MGAANNGLDLEMPSPRFMNAKALLAAVKDGTVKESTIDDKVLRLLRTVLRYGFLDRPQFDPADSTYSVADRAIALDGARESLTLLKNEGHLLPLDPAKIKTIAVIGPDAWPAVTGGGGSSEAQAFEPVSIAHRHRQPGRAPMCSVLYSRGLPDMDELFWGTQWEGGVSVATYPSKDFTGTPQEPHRAEHRRLASRNGGARKTRRRTASATPPPSRRKKPANIWSWPPLRAGAKTHYKVLVDGKEVLRQARAEGQVPQSATLIWMPAQTVNVVAEYLPHSRGERPASAWALPIEPELISADAREYGRHGGCRGCGRRLQSADRGRGP